jgi:hypothetical protein
VALSDRRLVEVPGPRMVPALVRPEDVAVFTVGGIGTDDVSLRETFGKVTARRLAEADIRPTDALTRVVEAAHAELAGGVRGKGELSAAMTARLPESMSLWCESCGSRHIDQNRRRGCPATVHRARRRSAGGELGRPDGFSPARRHRRAARRVAPSTQ